MNKAELIAVVKMEHQKLEDALSKLTVEQMESAQPDSHWTVKETLVHITAWEQVLLADYARLVKGEPIHELGSDDEINIWNAATQSRAKEMSLDHAMAEFDQSFRQIIEWLENLPEEDLSRPFAYRMNLGEFTGEDTWKHYSEHLPILTSRLKTI